LLKTFFKTLLTQNCTVYTNVIHIIFYEFQNVRFNHFNLYAPIAVVKFTSLHQMNQTYQL